MPTRLRKLRNEAENTCILRGHKMGRFSYNRNPEPTRGYSECKNPGCDGWVGVEVFPLPNSIEIGGSAVAENCPINRYKIPT